MIPDDIQLFSDTGTVEVARSILSDWDFFHSILSQDYPTGDVKGLHVPLVFSSGQSTRFRLCFAAVLNVIESLRLCNGIMRDDSSAAIIATGEFCSVLVTLLYIQDMYQSSKVSPFTDSIVMSFDVDFHPATSSKLALPGSVKGILDARLQSHDDSQRLMFLKKYIVFLSSLNKSFRDFSGAVSMVG